MRKSPAAGEASMADDEHDNDDDIRARGAARGPVPTWGQRGSLAHGDIAVVPVLAGVALVEVDCYSRGLQCLP
jgi:hypothetical protein